MGVSLLYPVPGASSEKPMSMKRYRDDRSGERQHRLQENRISTGSGESPGYAGGTTPGPRREGSNGAIEPFSFVQTRTGTGPGASHSMWRCQICKTTGASRDGLPETCVNCETVAANVMWWIGGEED